MLTFCLSAMFPRVQQSVSSFWLLLLVDRSKNGAGEREKWVSPEEQVRQSVLAFRSLSHTCRSLREFALPLLWNDARWKDVVVENIRQLVKLRDALRLMPHLGALVEKFTFRWWARFDGDGAENEQRSLLDMALLRPDDQGTHPRINNANDFNECFTEIVSQFTLLNSFRWAPKFTPMPNGVLEALRKLPDLRVLSTSLWYPKSYRHCKFLKCVANHF